MIWQSAPLPHFDERPSGSVIDTLIVHSIYVPGAQDPCDPTCCIAVLDQHQVSAHYLIDCKGGIWSLVPEEKRAWHAGLSKLPFADDERIHVNAFSIGVELTGVEGRDFTAEQYQALSELTTQVLTRHPLKNILGHDHIAPGRKTDPGPRFDWATFRSLVEKKNPKRSLRWYQG